MTVMIGTRGDRSEAWSASPWADEIEAWTRGFPQVDTFEGVVSDPQSLHKYLYAHADPVNGADPTGLFFATMAMGAGGLRSGISVKRLGAALVVLDRVTTAVDAFTAISSLVATGTIPLPLLAGLLISVVPGTGLAKLAGFGGKFLSPFIRAGRLTFNAGGDLASLLARGGAGRLVDAADAMTDAFRAFRSTIAHKGHNAVIHFAGDLGAVKVADKLGLEAVDDFLIRHTGIDGLYRHGDSIVIVEAKGYTTGRTATLGTTKYGEQISQDWIRRKAAELRSMARTQPEYAQSAKILKDALDSPDRIKVLLTKTEVGSNADEILDVAYELRNWNDLGTNTFRQ